MTNITQVAPKMQQSAIEIRTVDGTPRVDSRLIAERLDIQHKNLMETISKYLDEFQVLGLLPFETDAVKVEGQRGTKYHKYALLNEDQAVFALTLSRNTPEVVLLKLDLTAAFKNARQSQQQAATSQSTIPMLEFADTNRKLMDIFGITGNQATLALNNALRREFGFNALPTWGMTHLTAETQEQLFTVSGLAKLLGIKVRQVNPTLIEAGLQTSHRDHKDRIYYELTEKGLEYGLYLDTGKKHSDGTPVRQIKWYRRVVNLLEARLEDAFATTEGAA